MDVDISINSTQDIFRGSYIQFVIRSNQTVPTQPNGTVILSANDDLPISDDGKVVIDMRFYDGLCFIHFTAQNLSQRCTDPFRIPLDMAVKPINDNNYTLRMHSDDVVLTDESKVHHLSRKVQTLALNVSKLVYSGEVIHVNYSRMDALITQATSALLMKSTDLNIDVIVAIEYANNQCLIESVSTGTSRECADGILFHESKASMIGNKYEMTVRSEDTYITQHTIRIQIEHCEIGYGLLTNSQPCAPCPINTLNMYPNSQCLPCDNFTGVHCLGAVLKIEFNHWATFDPQKSALLSSYCPAGHCCLRPNGCFYDDSLDGLCANNRNASIPLCGGCSDGFAEVFGSGNCRECTENHYEYLLLPIFIALVYVLILAHTGGADAQFDPQKTAQKELNYKLLFVKDDIEAIKVAVFHPMVYLFQGIAIITIQTGYAFYLQPLLDIFSMRFVLPTDDDSSGICFTTNLTALSKEWWYLFLPGSMFLIILVYYVLYERLNVCNMIQ
eukprot:290145_1